MLKSKIKTFKLIVYCLIGDAGPFVVAQKRDCIYPFIEAAADYFCAFT